MITLYDHGAHIPLLWTHLIPATLEGRALHNVQNAMFAAAMAFSMGLKLEDIRHGLRTFDTTFFQAPGPDEHLRRASVQGDPRLRPQPGRGRGDVPTWSSGSTSAGRRIVVLAAPGDRRDEDIADIGRIAAGQFDRYILPAGRPAPRAGSPTRCRTCCATRCSPHGVPAEQILVIPDEQAAIDTALREAQPGDLLLHLRRRDHPELEAGHPVPARGARRAWSSGRGRRGPSPRRRAPRRSCARTSRREFVRDSRGVWLAARGGRLG